MAKGDNMEYYNYRCPVCEKDFDKDSDIVVCPLCGAPHHRECYEENGKCFFEDKHQEGFDYKSYIEEKTKKDEKLICPVCGTENTKDSRFCRECGVATQNYDAYDRHREEENKEQGAPYTPPSDTEPPFTQHNHPTYTTFTFDPMGGLKAEDEIGGGVTVGECAKFVKTSTPFYSRLFHQIHTEGRSRFSFSGFLFSGGWLLYRKMYKLGALITALLAIFIITDLYITTFYSELIIQLNQVSQSSFWFSQAENTITLQEFVASLDTEDIIVLIIGYIAEMAHLAIRILCGIFGNRWYRKHCLKKITSIKNAADSKEAADSQLQTKGGVNTALAFSLFASLLLLYALPYFF